MSALHTIKVILLATIGVVLFNIAWEMCKALWLRWRSRDARRASIDWGMRMQDAAERHLAAVVEAAYAEDEGQDIPTPAVAPYCGCDTCLVREVLAGAWPVIAEMFEHQHKYGLEMHLRGGDHG